MSRRVSMPGADELFRSTAKETMAPNSTAGDSQSEDSPQDADRAGSRAKHDEKMTVYLTASELMAVEQARLELRAIIGKKVDRGRLVRAALSLALDDLADGGVESPIARRLSRQ